MKTYLQALLIISVTTVSAVTARAVEAPAATEPLTEKARKAGVFTVFIENDYFGGQDQNYTNGFKFSWMSPDLASWGQTGWRQSVLEALPFVNRVNGQKNLGLAFGQNIYTPRDISRVPPDATDRPYAGWSYLEFTFASKTENIMDTLSLQIGMVGPHSYADDMQRFLHKLIDDEKPLGWDYQLKDELGINVVYERKWRLYVRSLNRKFGIDVVPHAGASVGNVQTYANVGGTVRLGTNLPSDFGPDLIRPAASNSLIDDYDPRISSDRRWSFLVFGGVDGRVVARDIFLDGNTFKDSPSVDREYLVGDAFYGLGIVRGKWQFTYTEVVRTREFEAQGRKSYFGSVTLSRIF
jgi:hypothetical protein